MTANKGENIFCLTVNSLATRLCYFGVEREILAVHFAQAARQIIALHLIGGKSESALIRGGGLFTLGLILIGILTAWGLGRRRS